MQNPTNSVHVRWIALVSLLIVVSAVIVARSSGLAQPNRAGLPVWGRKPVLEYFFFTASLADLLKKEVGLSEEQFLAAREIALQEGEEILRLEQESREFLSNNKLSDKENKDRLVETGYNRKVLDVIRTSQTELESAVGSEVYTTLVNWIEWRWLTEKALHDVATTTTGPRTFSIYATRYDTSAYTVALPDKCVKFSNIGWDEGCSGYGYDPGGDYRVRVAYQGASATVKVLEAGPWNLDDTYWATINDPTPRRMFTDLPLGIPEAQAAYFDGYNGGLDQYGRIVTAPYGIDLARDLSIDIGLLPGNNDWVDVTFLWTDGWDDPVSQEVVLKQPTKFEPPIVGDTCEDNWYAIDGYDGEKAYLTLNVKTEAYSTNSAEWAPDLPAAGQYRVEAYVSNHSSIYWYCLGKTIYWDTSDARYTIHHAGGTSTVSRDQAPLADQWVGLGTYEFDNCTSGKVQLSDLNGETDFSKTISFSAMRFSLLEAPTPTPKPTNTPTSTPTPTLTPTPAPFIWTEHGIVEPDNPITITIGASHIQPPGIGDAVIDLSYDPSVVEAVACVPDPDGWFDVGNCDLDFERDGNASDTLRFSLSSVSGVDGFPYLVDLIFRALGSGGEITQLLVQPDTFSDPQGTSIPYSAYGSFICIAPCETISFLPVVLNKGGP